jgi:hypothetical protein
MKPERDSFQKVINTGMNVELFHHLLKAMGDRALA